MKICIGVLDIQGSVTEHMNMLSRLKIKHLKVKNPRDLAHVDGLIIPGGESTTIGMLMASHGLDSAIKMRALSRSNPMTVWGTCAGAILLAKKVIGKTNERLDLMDITVERNGYGSQMDSFEVGLRIGELGQKEFPAIFIRAPRIREIGKKVKILAKLKDEPVMVQSGNLLATMFHPELTDDSRVHDYFITMTKRYAKN